MASRELNEYMISARCDDDDDDDGIIELINLLVNGFKYLFLCVRI